MQIVYIVRPNIFLVFPENRIWHFMQIVSVENCQMEACLVSGWNSYPLVRFPYPAWTLVMDSYVLLKYSGLWLSQNLRGPEF